MTWTFVLIEVLAEGMEELLSSGAYIAENRILNAPYCSHNSLSEAEVESLGEQDFANQRIRAMQKE